MPLDLDDRAPVPVAGDGAPDVTPEMIQAAVEYAAIQLDGMDVILGDASLRLLIEGILDRAFRARYPVSDKQLK